MNINSNNLIFDAGPGCFFDTVLSSAIAIASGRYTYIGRFNYENKYVVDLPFVKGEGYKREISPDYINACEYVGEKELTVQNNPLARTVEFDFNGTTVLVNGDSDPELIKQWWQWTCYDWNSQNTSVVGPYPARKLTSAQQAQKNQYEYDCALRRYRDEIEREEEYRKNLAEYNERLSVTAPFVFRNPEASTQWLKDTDLSGETDELKKGYANHVVEFTQELGRLIQHEMENGRQLEDVVEECSRLIYFKGTSGFQYSVVKAQLCTYWVHGDRVKAHFFNEDVTRRFEYMKDELFVPYEWSAKSEVLNTIIDGAKNTLTAYQEAYEDFTELYEMYKTAVQMGIPAPVTIKQLESLKDQTETLRDRYWSWYRTYNKNIEFDAQLFAEEQAEQEMLALIRA